MNLRFWHWVKIFSRCMVVLCVLIFIVGILAGRSDVYGWATVVGIGFSMLIDCNPGPWYMRTWR